jgi:DHA1 family tetracycline resistance protein-like MFS transporter
MVANLDTAVEAPSRSRTALLPLYVVVLIDSISYAIIVPVLPFLVMAKGAGANVGGALVAVHALAGIVLSPLFGRLSDRFGRKPIILWSLVGTALAYVGLAMASNLIGMFVARLVAGAMTGNLAVVSAGVADKSNVNDRAAAMAGITTCLAVGFVVGPGLSAALVGLTSNPGLIISLVAASLGVISFALVLFRYADGARAAPPAVRPEEAVAGSGLPDIGLLVILGATSFAQSGVLAMTGYWAAASFGWRAGSVSLLMLWCAVALVASQVALVRPLAKTFGETRVVAASAVVAAASATAMIVFPRSVTIVLWAAPLLFVCFGLFSTMANALISKAADSVGQGRVMGVVGSVQGVGRILGPLLASAMLVRLGVRSEYYASAATAAVALGAILLSRSHVIASSQPARPQV